MTLFKLAQGPWTLLLSGTQQGHEIEIYTNPQKMVYVQLTRVENGKKISAACEFHQPYVVTGDILGFIQTLPREVLLVTRHMKDETTTYLIAGSGPVSVEWEESLLLEQADILLKKLEVSNSLLADVAGAYGITLQPLGEALPVLGDAFFTLPLLVPLLSTNAHGNEERGGSGGGATTESSAAGHMGALPGEFVLGTSANGVAVKEPVSFFKKTGIFNGRPEHRTHLLQVLSEGALFSNIPIVIVDWQNQFSLMRNPNPDTSGLKEQKIEGDPIGFPLKEFLPPENLKVDLSQIYPEALEEILGIQGRDLGTNLTRLLHEHKVSSINEAIGVLHQIPPSETFTPFQIGSLVRVLTLLDQSYPGLFNGTNPTEEIAKSWFQSIGRVGVLRLQNVSPPLKRVLVYTVLRGVYDMMARRGVSGRVKAFFVIPEAHQLFDTVNAPLLSREIERVLALSNSQDVGFILASMHEMDLPKNVLLLLEAKLSIIGGKEAAVTLTGRKNYRLQVRDTYSQPIVGDFFKK